MAMNFVSNRSFTLPDEILRQLRRSEFVSGTTTGPEKTKALVEGALDPLAREASRKEAMSRDFALREEELGLQEQNISSMAAFREGSLALDRDRIKAFESQSRAEAFKGFGELLFTPIPGLGSTSLGGAVSKGGIGSGILHIFKKIFT